MKRVIALGFFDSIHIGHRLLIERGRLIAEQKGAEFALATFGDDFLTSVGRKEEEIFLLNERKEILEELGVKNVITLPADKKFLSCGKTKFLGYLSTFNPCAFICGKDYRFARGAEGTAQDLKEYFAVKGVETEIFDLLCENGEKVSSRVIRKYLNTGEIEAAVKLLGQRFFYEGTVKRGRKDGRKIGFPTVNIDISPEKIKIKSGVYVTVTVVDKKRYRSVTNVGTHPTFGDGVFNVETYVLGNPGELYGEKIKVEFCRYIRGIQKFNDKNELAERIRRDVEFAKEVNIDD